MTPEQWRSLTEQQQTAHAYQYGPPPPGYLTTPEPVVKAGVSVWAVVSVTIGTVGVLTLLLPMSLPGLVLGAAAVVFGVVGMVRRGRRGWAAAGVLLGLFCLLVVVVAAVH